MKNKNSKVSTGLEGLDDILKGGYFQNRAYLIRGGPGVGKTILGFHFLAAKPKTPSLLISFSETEEELQNEARKVGFNKKSFDVLDLSPESNVFEEEEYDVFHPSEVEKSPMMENVKKKVEELKPKRVFFDALTHLRYLSSDQYQFRKYVLGLSRYFKQKGISLLFTSEPSDDNSDKDLQFLADGIIQLEKEGRRRSLEVMKVRGSDFRSGKHSMEITDEGIKVYPRLGVPHLREEYSLEQISSGIPEIDEMLKGGLERGTVSLFSGPSGVGKTSLGLQFIKEAAGRGKRSAVYLFEEDKNLLINRSQNINIPVKNMIEEGNLIINQIEPLDQTADQFAYNIKKEVEENGTEIVLIDSVDGYELSIKGERLRDRIFSLCQYFRQMGVTALVTNEVSRITGDFQVTETGISFTVDNVIFMRYLEMEGQLRKTIGVLKKRISDFERCFREWNITPHGIKVGEPLTGLRGILTGNPEWVNTEQEESSQ